MFWSEVTIGKLMASLVSVVCPTRRLIAVEMTSSSPPWHKKGITVLLSRKALFRKKSKHTFMSPCIVCLHTKVKPVWLMDNGLPVWIGCPVIILKPHSSRSSIYIIMFSMYHCSGRRKDYRFIFRHFTVTLPRIKATEFAEAHAAMSIKSSGCVKQHLLLCTPFTNSVKQHTHIAFELKSDIETESRSIALDRLFLTVNGAQKTKHFFSLYNKCFFLNVTQFRTNWSVLVKTPQHFNHPTLAVIRETALAITANIPALCSWRQE